MTTVAERTRTWTARGRTSSTGCGRSRNIVQGAPNRPEHGRVARASSSRCSPCTGWSRRRSKTNDQIFTTEFIPFPTSFTFEHLDRVLSEGVAGNSIWLYLRNSAIVALGTVAVGAVFSLLAATAVARFRFKGRTSFLIALLVVQMIPAEALLIPLFLSVKRLGLYDQLLGLIVINVGLTLPFGIWMLRTFVAAVPKSLEEAAWIDGASRMTAFWKVLFPLGRAGPGGDQHLLVHHGVERADLRL